MKLFLDKHASKILGTLSSFDRVLFRGYLPLESGGTMANFLYSHGIQRTKLKDFLLQQAARLKQHAYKVANEAGRPVQYLAGYARKEDLARDIAEKDGIQEGLVCVFSTLESCRSFSLTWKEGNQGTWPFIRPAKRKCLFYYYYFLDRDFGLIHVKLQTWFPFRIQVYVNGHEWLARRLDRSRSPIPYLKYDNAFLRVADFRRAQSLSDRFATLPWVRILHAYAKKVNPLLGELLGPMTYYWTTSQAEYSTDIMFKDRKALEELMPRLLQHSLVSFNADDVMTFLGRKLSGNFRGELVSDLHEFPLKGRLPGRRVKHRMKANWIKMYDKAGVVLRIEMVINSPEEFRVRRRVHRNGKRVTRWVPLRKGVGFLFRYRDISRKSNQRYLDALTPVDDPTPALQHLDALTSRRRAPSGRSVRPFNPLAKNDRALFQALLAGEHFIHGFTNCNLREKLRALGFPLHPEVSRQTGQVCRLLARLHAYRLVAKVPRSRRWRVSASGLRLMSATVQLREVDYPGLYRRQAA